ncbi:MAG: amino acid racemase [Rickettsiales bacterium]|nr:amino acid racemase [Rickettsiales bacterium]
MMSGLTNELLKGGIIAGTSYQSSGHYYMGINEGVNNVLGDAYSAPLSIESINFQIIEPYVNVEKPTADGLEFVGNYLNAHAKILERSGANFIACASNTVHIVADKIMHDVNPPLLHIADATAEDIERTGIGKVGLLGTGLTMREPFYKERLQKQSGVQVYVPRNESMDRLNEIIFEELCSGNVFSNSIQQFESMIHEMVRDYGIQGVILGCTELNMLIKKKLSEYRIHIFDTTQIHINSIVKRILNGNIH